MVYATVYGCILFQKVRWEADTKVLMLFCDWPGPAVAVTVLEYRNNMLLCLVEWHCFFSNAAVSAVPGDQL